MNCTTGMTLMVIAGFACGAYLVTTEHYGWAWIPFLVVMMNCKD